MVPKGVLNQTYGGPNDECANAVIQTSDGGYALAGYSTSFTNGGYDMWLVKTDYNGSLLWSQNYGGKYDDVACSVVEAFDGGYILAGYSTLPNQTATSFLVKVDSSGIVEWTKKYSGTSVTCLIKTLDGNYAFSTEYDNAFGLNKINNTGHVLINQVYDAPYNKANSSSIVQTATGEYALAGAYISKLR